MNAESPLILVRGGGDLATGVAARLHRSGFAIVVTEIAQPLAVRRLVALAEAVYAGEVGIEDLRGRKVEDIATAREALAGGIIPVLVDPEGQSRHELHPLAIVDGRMLKHSQPAELESEPLIVGLGPGFTAGVNCHAVVETKRGHALGRVRWEGAAEPDTGIPEPVSGHAVERVLRAPAAGELRSHAALGSLVKKDDLIATVGNVDLLAPFDGALRGLMHDGVHVEASEKIGDLDPRNQVGFCFHISDKALAVGGGVLEALLSRPEIRRPLGA
jgi:xanthine dehydrogenase accessory factor